MKIWGVDVTRGFQIEKSEVNIKSCNYLMDYLEEISVIRYFNLNLVKISRFENKCSRTDISISLLVKYLGRKVMKVVRKGYWWFCQIILENFQVWKNSSILQSFSHQKDTNFLPRLSKLSLWVEMNEFSFCQSWIVWYTKILLFQRNMK